MSSDQPSVKFDVLGQADLVPGWLYECDRGNTRMTSGADPLPRLLGAIGNQGGFRKRNGIAGKPVVVALTSSESHPDWPDSWDPATGRYLYFGDNRTPGRDLHDTPRGGNVVLRDIFSASHGAPWNRKSIPIVLVFRKGNFGRDQEFVGLAVPGADGVSEEDELVAVWRTGDAGRFQNYRAIFTILDTGRISGAWVRRTALERNVDLDGSDVPTALTDWIDSRVYRARTDAM